MVEICGFKKSVFLFKIWIFQNHLVQKDCLSKVLVLRNFMLLDLPWQFSYGWIGRGRKWEEGNVPFIVSGVKNIDKTLSLLLVRLARFLNESAPVGGWSIFNRAKRCEGIGLN